MSEKTIFGRIIDREIPADILYEDDQVLAFRDINPQAPVHLLIVPKKPIPSVDALSAEDHPLMGHLWTSVIPQIARQQGLSNGYRVVVNCGPDGGQDVAHLHFHLLGGRPMAWPPG